MDEILNLLKSVGSFLIDSNGARFSFKYLSLKVVKKTYICAQNNSNKDHLPESANCLKQKTQISIAQYMYKIGLRCYPIRMRAISFNPHFLVV